MKDGEEGSYTCRTPIVRQYLFVNSDGNKINNADPRLGICSKFLFNPSFIKQQISAA